MNGNVEHRTIDTATDAAAGAPRAGQPEGTPPGPGVRYESRPDGLANLVFDRPGAKVNILNGSLLAVLEILLGQAARDRNVRGLVVTSARPGSFIAGADIREIEALGSAEDAETASRRGQRLFALIERLPFPVVAAINGTCLGGGTELALACHFRVAADAPQTEIGLPEVRLGLLPGWGGTQRLPRLIGLRPALDLILTGRSLNARRALRAGLVDAVAPPERLMEAAAQIVDEACAGRRRFRTRGDGALARLNPIRAAHIALISALARRGLRRRIEPSQYPAPYLALQAVTRGLKGAGEEGYRREARLLGRLAVGSTSRNLVALFSMRQSGRRDGIVGDPSVTPREVNAAGVIGAGTMGGGIAQALARAGIHVRLKDIDAEALGRAMRVAFELGQADLRGGRIPRGEFERRMDRILPTLDYTGLRRAQIVVEAVIESLEVKRRVLGELEALLPEQVVFATNTSSLPIERIARGARRPENVVGMHFFNPVHRMPLVEVIRAPQTSDEAVAMVVALSRRIGKTPIVVADSPGFLVNRVLMAYLGEALLLLEEGARIEEIDTAMVSFGLPMGPLAVIDQVGVDVAAHVAAVLTEAFDWGPRSNLLRDMGRKGWLGRKTGLGFYLYSGAPGDGGKRVDAARAPRRVNAEIYELFAARERRTLDAAAIESRLVLPMVNEAARCLESGIVRSAAEVDLAMVMGAGFPAFRGGLLRHADSLGTATVAHGLEILAAHHGPRFTAAPRLTEMARDGRRFFPR